MAATSPSSERSVEWATAKPNGEGFFDNLVLDREQAVEYGDEMVMSLRVDGPILREREINPEEPFARRVEDGELIAKQISRKPFEEVAESDRDDAGYAKRTLERRATQRLRNARK